MSKKTRKQAHGTADSHNQNASLLEVEKSLALRIDNEINEGIINLTKYLNTKEPKGRFRVELSTEDIHGSTTSVLYISRNEVSTLITMLTNILKELW